MKTVFSFLLALHCCEVGQAAELKGLWEFDDGTNLAKATVGTDLILGGTHTHHSTLADDAATALSGAITTAGGTASYLKALHGIAANGGGTLVNQYSIVVDLFSPAASRGNWRAIFQTAATPTANDADYFIRNTDDALGTAAWGYSSGAIHETKWTRLVITVDLSQAGGASTPKYRTYLDGNLFHTHTGTNEGALNGRFSLFPVGDANHGIHFFADNTAAENPPMNIGAIAIYDGVLSAGEVAALGGAGDPIQVPPSNIPDGLVGLWDFHDPTDLGKATYGDDLAIVGTAPAHAASLTDGNVLPTTLEGAITTVQGTGNRLLATHAIGANGGGTKTNQYSLVFDVLVPGTGQWRSFYQTTTANNNDAEYFVRNTNNTLGRLTVGYSNGPLDSNRWHRLVLSVDLTSTGFYRAYLDGEPFHTHTKPALDSDYALDPSQVLLFADNDGENHPLSIGMAAVFSKALSAQEAQTLGGPGIALITDSYNQPPAVVSATAGPETASTGVIATYFFRASDPENETVQIQADWGDGKFSPWSGFTAPGTPQSLGYAWSMPGTFAIRARARDAQGAISPWVSIQNVTVTGAPVVTFLTQPYLQNMGTDRMVVMWETTEDVALSLRFGLPGSAGIIVPAERVASGGGSYFHRALLRGLQPGTHYAYRVAYEETDLTAPSSFRTAPAAWEDFTFGAIGDTQTTNGGTWQADPWEPAKIMLQDMVNRGASFGLALGDLAQDGNSYTTTRNSFLNRWAAVFGPHRPFYVSWGNHDGSSPTHPLRLAADMPSRWQTAESSSTRTPGYGNYWFEHSGVLFVCLEYFQTNNKTAADPTNDLTNGWLDAVLSSPRAQAARFRIVAVHVPPYCERWINGNANLRAQLVPRLEHYGVDLCMSGHMHGYERGRINGVQYVISGSGSYLDFPEPLVANWSSTTDDGLWLGGHNPVPGQYARQSSNGVLGPPQPIVGGLFHGYSQITVRERYMRLDQHGFNADGSYIGILDTIEFGGPDPGPDTDGDGMRDAWELANGLNPNLATGIHGPSGDLDGDGQTNYQEMLAGTAANDPTSVFRAQVASVTPSGMLLVWSSVPGKRYRIETSENMTQWTPLRDGNGATLVIDASQGTTTSHAVPAAGHARRFARVEVVAD